MALKLSEARSVGLCLSVIAVLGVCLSVCMSVRGRLDHERLSTDFARLIPANIEVPKRRIPNTEDLKYHYLKYTLLRVMTTLEYGKFE